MTDTTAPTPADRLRAVLFGASTTNPETAAQEQNAARAAGLPPAALAGVPAQQRPAPRQTFDADGFALDFPRTASFLSDPVNAAVAGDPETRESLSLLERTLFTAGDLTRRLAEGSGTALGTMIRGTGRAGARTFDNTGLEQLFEDVVEVGITVQRGARNVGGTLPAAERERLLNPLPAARVDTGFGGEVASGLGQIAAQALTLVGTGGTGGTVLLGAQGVGAMDERVEAQRAEQGRVGAEYTLAEDAALIGGGAVTALSERLGLDAIMGRLPKPLRDRIQSRLGQVIAAGVTEGATEVAETIGSNALAVYLLGEDTALLDGTVEAGSVGAAVGSLANAIVQSAVPGRQAAAQAERAQQDAETVRALAENAANNPLRQRSQAAFEEFVARAAEGGPVTDLYVSAEALNQSGVDLNALRAAVPAVDQQLDQAIADGGDVRIPVEQFAARVAGTDFADPLLDHMRINPALPSQAEVSALAQEQQAQLAADAERVLQDALTDDAFRQSAARVEQGLVDQLNAAGRFTPDVNRSYASLASNFYTVQAQRLGITPEQMAERYPLRIQAELPQAQRDATLDQQQARIEPETATDPDTVRLVHFARRPDLTTADPAQWGASRATSQAERMRARAGVAPGRTYFYDRNVRPVPEQAVAAVSPFRYSAAIQRSELYDFDADPLGLRPAAGEDTASAYEAAVRDAGYRGFFSNEVVKGAVAVFDPIPLRAEGLIRTIQQAQAVERRAAELQQQERLARVAAKTDPSEIVASKPLEQFRGKAMSEVFADDARMQPLAGAPKTALFNGERVSVKPFAPAREAAYAYMEAMGLRYEPPTEYAKVDPARAKRLADAFDQMAHAPDDPVVRAAYSALIEETMAQYQFVKATGLEIEFIEGDDPYAASPRAAIQDVIENNHLWVFPTDAGFGSAENDGIDNAENPMMVFVDEWVGDRQLRANDVFRVVHDYFGHIKDGHGFRAEGEENAWQSHAAMYSPLARRALTTETRGQNSWVNFGPFAEFNKTASAAETEYAPQKVGLMPTWASEDGFLGGIESGLPEGQTLDQGSAVATDTPEFRAWFGDSKVVDENGAPLVVYHATNKDFDAFAEGVSWFGTAAFANTYAKVRFGYWKTKMLSWADDPMVHSGLNILPVYVSIRNPFSVPGSLEKKATEEDVKAAAKSLGVTEEEILRAALDSSIQTYADSYVAGEAQRLGVSPEAALATLRAESRARAERAGVAVAALYRNPVAAAAAQAKGHDGLFADEAGTPVWAAFSPTQIKSVFNRGTFDPNDPRILYQSDVPANPPFFSALTKAVADSKTASAPASQWLATLRKTSGVKAEEIEWSGLEEWLGTVEGNAKREDVLAFLQNGGVKVEEVVLGEGAQDIGLVVELDDETGEWAVRDEYGETVTAFRYFDDAERYVANERYEAGSDAQFATYKLPGADETYREILLTLPNIEGPSTHWNEPNVVAHARITTRTDASGAKVLFLEEVQSDWHQKGRDEGYQQTISPERLAALRDAEDAATGEMNRAREALADAIVENLSKQADELDAAIADYITNPLSPTVPEGVNQQAGRLRGSVTFLQNGGDPARILGDQTVPVSASTPEIAPLYRAFSAARLRVQEARTELRAPSYGIPNAPFQKSWSQLVMKRMIRYAVDTGHDKVAWINGNQQNGGQTGGDGSFFYERNLVNTTNDLIKKFGGRVEREFRFDWNSGTVADPEVAELRKEYDRLSSTLRRVSMRNPLDGPAELRRRAAELRAEEPPADMDRDEMRARYEAAAVNLEEAIPAAERWLVVREELAARASDRVFANPANFGFTITDQMRAQAQQGFPLFQQNRGQISFGSDITQTPSTITLLRTADLSTFLHETGHFFLEVTNDIARRPDAPAEIKQDMETLLAWFGVDSIETWNSMPFERKRESHERFARGFEAFLMEGRAPTPGLRELFQRFRSWLLNVYRSMLQLNVELTDDVRAVMGRMLASQNEIAEAEAYHNFSPLAEKPPYMSDEAWADYQRTFASATDEGVDTLSTRAVRDMRWLSGARSKALRKLQSQARSRRKQVKAEVTAEVMAEPVNRARQYLRRGLGPDGEPVPGAQKLDLAALRAIYGEGPDAPWRRLKIGGKYGEAAADGLHPDVAAELLGYESGDALVRDLASAEDANQKIAGLTDQRMLERYGDMADEAGIERAADEAIANEAHARAIATDYAALAQATGQPRALAAAARTYAAGIVNRIELKRLKPNQFFAAMTRAGKAADKAARAGDLVAAATQRRNQLINLQAAKYAIDARAQVEEGLATFQRIISAKDDALSRSRDMALVNGARAILSLYGLGRVKNDPLGYLDRVKSYDPQLYADIQPFVEGARGAAKPLDEITFEQFQGLRDTVLQLWALSRRTRQIELDGQLVDIETARQALSARLDEIGLPEQVPGMAEAPSPMDRAHRYLQGARAALRRVESWVRAVDAADSGPFRTYIWNPVSTAADRYRVEQAAYLRRFLDIVRPIESTLTNAKIAAPEIGYTFTGKAELLHAILHTGNSSNMSKLLLGRRWGSLREDGSLDTSRWDAMLQRMWREGALTKADYDFAQGVWDLLDETKIGAQQAHRAMYGRYFSEVTAEPIQTPFGEYRGGYVPATTDGFLVQDAQLRQEQEALEDSNAFMFPAASNGFTKARVEDYTRELSLDIRLLPMHIDKVLRFTHLGPPVRDVARLLRGRAFSAKLSAFDPVAASDMLLPWLQRAARQVVQEPMKGQAGRLVDGFFRELRNRTGMQLMFANLSNTLQQVTGFSNAAVRVRPSKIAAGMWTYIRDPKGTADAITSLSPFMASRTSSQVFEMRQTIEQLLLNPSKYEKLRDFSQRHAYFMQFALQNVIDLSVWRGAYNQAIERGDAEREAIRFADSVIRETQSAMAPEDVSRFETGTAFTRLFTQFYSYFNNQANLLGTEFQTVARTTGVRNGAGRLLYLYVTAFAVPALLADLIATLMRGGFEDDEEDGYLDELLQWFVGSQVRFAVAGVPVVGQVANAALGGFTPAVYDDRISTSPAISVVESGASLPGAIYDAVVNGEALSRSDVRDLFNVMGLITGTPLGALGRPVSYGYAVGQGDVEPTSAADAARGFVTGTPSPESRVQ